MAARYLLKDVTASETTYSFIHDDGGDASRVVHSWRVVQDPTGAAKLKYFHFWQGVCLLHENAGQELAASKPELQHYDLGLGPDRKTTFKFTISPTGEYIAEGGDGIINIYRIDR